MDEQNLDIRPLIKRIVDAVKTCYDPEIPVDILELGLIYDIRIEPGNDVIVTMSLTSPNCPAAEALPLDVETKVKALPDVNSVKVEVTFDPTWDREMMSEEAKMELGFW